MDTEDAEIKVKLSDYTTLKNCLVSIFEQTFVELIEKIISLKYRFLYHPVCF